MTSTVLEANAGYLPASQARPSIRTVALASMVGTAIEWYDFFLYITASALVFNRLFFPTIDPRLGTLAAFGTSAVGFAARPIGGIIIGHFGDRVGRKSTLVVSLAMMGIATFCIGLLPTYKVIGVWGAVGLVVLRIVQGVGVGGEWGGAVLMAIEHAPPKKRGFYGSWPQVGVPIGLLLANGAFWGLSSMNEAAFLSWGWRLPFLFSIALVGVGLFIRLRLTESPAFVQVKETRREATLPLSDVLRTSRRAVVLAILVSIGEKGAFYVYTGFLLSYGTQELGLPRSTMLGGVLIAATCMLFAVPVAGILSDRFGRRPVYGFGGLCTALMAYPLYRLIDTKSPPLVWLAMTMAVVLAHSPMWATEGSLVAEMFSTRLRYTGASLSNQVAGAIGGGLSPFIATALMPYGRAALAGQLAVMGLLAVVTLAFLPETARQSLRE